MSRKKEIINNSNIPTEKLENIAESIWPSILEYFESEEGKAEYERIIAEENIFNDEAA